MRTPSRFSLTILLLCGAAFVGCGELPDEGVEQTSAALLGTPGAFYKFAPDFGFCGNSTNFECHGGYSFNSKGAKPSFLRRAVGLTRVTFENLATGGNVQVSASATNAHCNVISTFPSGTGIGIDVLCRAPTGAQVDSKYMLSYYRDTNVGGALGAYANVRNTAPLSIVNAWNSSGGPINVAAMGVGAYRVSLVGQSFAGDNALVTPTTSAAAYCTLAGWSPGGGGVNVDVRCFGFSGVPMNTDFALWYGKNVRGEPRNQLLQGSQGALVVVGAGGGVDAARSRNSCQMGANLAVLQQPGNTYVETYHAVTTFPGEVPLMSLVTAISTAGAYCNLMHFPIQGVRSNSTGRVSCFTPAGASTTSMHSSHFLIQDHSGC